jgi:hypothetical protein
MAPLTQARLVWISPSFADVGSATATLLADSERCPSGLRSATGNRVGGVIPCLEGSNPSLSAFETRDKATQFRVRPARSGVPVSELPWSRPAAE